MLPQYEDAILSIKTSTTSAPDSVIWLHEKSGRYSTKTGYGIGMSDECMRNADRAPVNWLKHVWNVKRHLNLRISCGGF